MTIVTGKDNIKAVRRHALYGALKLEARSGLKRSSRGPSTLSLVNAEFGWNHKRKAAALEAMEELGYGSR